MMEKSPGPFDVVVIGGGPGGYVAAIRAAQLGLRTAVVEKDPLGPGGTCLWRGCIPTKCLLQSAETYDIARRGKEFGVNVQGASLDMTAVHARKDKIVRQLGKGVEGLLKKRSVAFRAGTGRIAGIFSRGVLASQTGRLAAVGSRAQATADRFAREYRVARAHGSYEALLADPGVQAVYVATPHPHHAEWTMRAAQAGKHVLCEKPLTLNHAQAVTVVEAARAAGVLLMEAFMYRCHPQTARVV